MNQTTTKTEVSTRRANRPITMPEAMYLKHVGETNDTKVSISIRDGFPFIRIRDWEFSTFNNALRCIQHIVENEIVSGNGEEVRS